MVPGFALAERCVLCILSAGSRISSQAPIAVIPRPPLRARLGFGSAGCQFLPRTTFAESLSRRCAEPIDDRSLSSGASPLLCRIRRDARRITRCCGLAQSQKRLCSSPPALMATQCKRDAASNGEGQGGISKGLLIVLAEQIFDACIYLQIRPQVVTAAQIKFLICA